jgi:hypothetical protein
MGFRWLTNYEHAKCDKVDKSIRLALMPTTVQVFLRVPFLVWGLGDVRASWVLWLLMVFGLSNLLLWFLDVLPLLSLKELLFHICGIRSGLSLTSHDASAT